MASLRLLGILDGEFRALLPPYIVVTDYYKIKEYLLLTPFGGQTVSSCLFVGLSSAHICSPRWRMAYDNCGIIGLSWQHDDSAFFCVCALCALYVYREKYYLCPQQTL